MNSKNYKTWYSIQDLRRCVPCKQQHGKIYEMREKPIPSAPLHDRCRCVIQPMDSRFAGAATNQGMSGVDLWVKNYGQLPRGYVSYADALKEGWEPLKGNLQSILPGMTVGGDVYSNRNGHLPEATGRIWYEADINYTGGYRGNDRIVFSNDGLIFVTYDHYQTFTEVI